jgi:hypothetical protein
MLVCCGVERGEQVETGQSEGAGEQRNSRGIRTAS